MVFFCFPFKTQVDCIVMESLNNKIPVINDDAIYDKIDVNSIV